MSKIQQFTRPDGLRIFTKRLPYTNEVQISVAIMAGSASDPKDKLGLFHFFEHMAYQGTETRTAKEIAAFLDRYTAINNAGTGRLSVEFYGVSVDFNQHKLFEILSDIFLNSTFPEEEFQKERGVISTEIATYESDDNKVAIRNLTYLLYKNNPAKQSGLGTLESLMKINRKILLKTHREFFVPSNTVIVATGNIQHSDIIEKVNSFFPELKDVFTDSINTQVISDEASLPIPEKEMIISKPQKETATICMGVKLPNFTRKEWIIAEILSDLLGGGESSLLYSELRQKRGLVYATRAGIRHTVPLYQYFIFFSKTRPEKCDEVKKIMKEVIFNQPINLRDFQENVEKRREEAYIALKPTASSWNKNIMAKVESGRDLSILERYPQKLSKVLNSITFEDILEMRRKFITEERLATSIITTI